VSACPPHDVERASPESPPLQRQTISSRHDALARTGAPKNAFADSNVRWHRPHQNDHASAAGFCSTSSVLRSPAALSTSSAFVTSGSISSSAAWSAARAASIGSAGG
jgi:hypothetical protein